MCAFHTGLGEFKKIGRLVKSILRLSLVSVVAAAYLPLLSLPTSSFSISSSYWFPLVVSIVRVCQLSHGATTVCYVGCSAGNRICSDWSSPGTGRRSDDAKVCVVDRKTTLSVTFIHLELISLESWKLVMDGVVHHQNHALRFDPTNGLAGQPNHAANKLKRTVLNARTKVTTRINAYVFLVSICRYQRW